jgi:hypothetical protein
VYRVLVAIASCVLVLVTLSPVLRSNPYDDGFPLSTYPMFASVRPTEHRITYPLGVTRTGERRTLTPRLVGSGEILQALRIVDQAAKTKAATRALCVAIAQRVRDAGNDELVAIRIVTATHDALAVLLEDKLGAEREMVRCPVPR